MDSAILVLSDIEEAVFTERQKELIQRRINKESYKEILSAMNFASEESIVSLFYRTFSGDRIDENSAGRPELLSDVMQETILPDIRIVQIH